MNYASYNKSGFTLIEILMAVTIFTIGILGIVSMFPQTKHVSRLSFEDLSLIITSDMISNYIKTELDKDFSASVSHLESYDAKFSNNDAGVYVCLLDDTFFREAQLPKTLIDIDYDVSISNENQHLKKINFLIKGKRFEFFVSQKN